MRMHRRRTARASAAGLALALLSAGGCNGQTTVFSPRGAERQDEDVWAIRCVTLRGANRVTVAQNYEKSLRDIRGLKPDQVQLFHDAKGSTVFYGRYRRRYDAATGKSTYKPDPLRDLALIRQLSFEDSRGGQAVWPFRLADIEALPTTPIGNPAWDLTLADDYWTVHVGVFYNTGGMNRRKYAATEYCKLLREQGHEAYYHHGPVHSSVCVGLFPKSSIVDLTREDPLSGVLRATRKIVDPRMLELLKKFPDSLQNGHRTYEIIRDSATGEVTKRIPIPSFPALTPHGDQLAEQASR